MPELQTEGCALTRCTASRDPDVETEVEHIPGVMMEHGFCSDEHREEYLEEYSKEDSFGDVANQIEDAGHSIEDFRDEDILPG